MGKNNEFSSRLNEFVVSDTISSRHLGCERPGVEMSKHEATWERAQRE